MPGITPFPGFLVSTIKQSPVFDQAELYLQDSLIMNSKQGTRQAGLTGRYESKYEIQYAEVPSQGVLTVL